MTTLVNRTPYALASAFGRDAEGRSVLFISVKATYTWDRSGNITLEDPIPLLMQDELCGEGQTLAPLRAAEVGPPKPKVDVLLAGAIVFPAPITEIDVNVEVGDGISKTVRVMGARVWIPGVMRDMVPSRPVPVTRVPIDWRCSFGGTDLNDGNMQEPRNPAGSGIARSAKALEGKPAPSFEDPSRLIQTWKSRPAPQGFGPVAPHWQPRARRAGTYDERWKRERWPLLPTDFDPVHYNVAPDDQQLAHYRPGDEVRLRYMTAAGHDRWRLPVFEPPLIVATDEALVETVAAVDTVIIEPEERRLSLVARATCPLSPDDGPFAHEIVLGEPSRGHRRALERGKRFRRPRAGKRGAAP